MDLPIPTPMPIPALLGCRATGASGTSTLRRLRGGSGRTAQLQCGACHSNALIWRESNRRGVIASFSIVHRGPTSAFRDHLPYVLALVDMTEGVRLMLNVIGTDRLDTPESAIRWKSCSNRVVQKGSRCRKPKGAAYDHL
ncbi:MAG: OB-fold domain-containing protein [Thalassovita sp.]